MRVWMANLFLIFTGFVTLVSYQVHAQGLYSYLPELIQDRKKASISIETIRTQDNIMKVEPRKLGSGFLALKHNIIYAVTNFHVVKNLNTDDELLVGVNLKQGKVYNLAKIISFSADRDVAVLALEDSILRRPTEGPIDTSQLRANQLSVGVSTFADSSDFREGTEVVVIGFPLGLGTYISGNNPVSRRGMIAQSLRPDGTFLIDGVASHGNSGSPVFSAEDGAKLLGIIVGFPPDYIQVFDEQGRLAASLPYNSGLSVCISSMEIWKLIP